MVVVDGDPGDAEVRDALVRLAVEGPRAGIHLLCLAETSAASAASPVTRTYEAACAVTPAFRECGAVALLSGDVATTLRLLRVAGPVRARHRGRSVTARSPRSTRSPRRGPNASRGRWHRCARRAPRHGAPAGVGAAAPVGAAAGRAGAGPRHPASLMARWADAADDRESVGGRVSAVLGAGPRGPVCADLAAEGPHLLVEGPSGSGRTELLRPSSPPWPRPNGRTGWASSWWTAGAPPRRAAVRRRTADVYGRTARHHASQRQRPVRMRSSPSR
ncbi:hypothetical protein ACR6C2_18890 [Streptomyces sp. INA 01156]